MPSIEQKKLSLEGLQSSRRSEFHLLEIHRNFDFVQYHSLIVSLHDFSTVSVIVFKHQLQCKFITNHLQSLAENIIWPRLHTIFFLEIRGMVVIAYCFEKVIC